MMLAGATLRARQPFAAAVSPAWVRFMSAAADYDVVVIGGGPGGYVAAIKAGQLGLKAACIESRGSLGGTCLNVGCIPSKSLLHSSHMYEEAKLHFAEHGVVVDNVRVDLEKMMASKRTAVKGLTGGIEMLLAKNKVEYVKGFGKITGTNSVEAALADGSKKVLNTKNIIIATGSEPSTLPSLPVDNDKYRIVDSTGALSLPTIPKKMAVVGAGVIGLELGSVWRRLGTEVFVVEFLDTILPSMDKEVSNQMTRLLKSQGMKFMLGQKVVGSQITDSGVKMSMEPSAGGAKTELDVDCVLVSTGRRPFTKGLGLESVGITPDRFGRVEVDGHLRTKVPSIYAIGDVIAGPMLAHKAEEEGIAAVENIAGSAGHVNYDCIPGVVYTSPEVASVGKTEEELIKAGKKYKKGTFIFKANSRARANMDTDGFVKMLSCAETDKILGIHIIGSAAGEMIAEGVLAMEYGASSEDVARTCHAHPTLSEAFKEAAMATYNKPIHM